VPALVATGLTRTFRVVDRSRGLAGALRDLVRTDRRERIAVAGVDFSVAPGETVALIGPNGAGKSTTVKMLTGILKPTAGTVRAGGLDPWADRTRHVRQLGVVFGQRTQLWWDLAVIEAFDLLAAMFDVPDATYKARLAHFDTVLGIGPLLRTPVRQLSLGERMRCELAAALLHDPRFLLLDEPTIGLDVAVKLRLRAFLAELRDAGRTTLLLTTHDLADVSALCPRVLLLSDGKLLHDGPLDALTTRLGGRRSLHVTLRAPASDSELDALLRGLPAGERDGPDAVRIRFDERTVAPDLIRVVLDRADVADLRLDDPSVEELIAGVYERRA
jgi:ABC-2 type transport system ATP-binding protein